jgi:hypothetical protein
LKKIEGGNPDILSRLIQKISLENFEQEMKKILEIFPNSFDQKFQKNLL